MSVLEKGIFEMLKPQPTYQGVSSVFPGHYHLLMIFHPLGKYVLRPWLGSKDRPPTQTVSLHSPNENKKSSSFYSFMFWCICFSNKFYPVTPMNNMPVKAKCLLVLN